jgi:hypothetical protein
MEPCPPSQLRLVTSDVPKTKICTKCGAEKPEADFNRYGGKKRGIRPDCRVCQHARNAAYIEKNREKRKAYHRQWRLDHYDEYVGKDAAWRARNKDKIKAKNARRAGNTSRGYNLCGKYGITEADYAVLFERQSGRCAVCRTDKPGGMGNRLHVDHDHVTGKVRGLLCHHCNSGLGNLRDDILRLKAAIAYLENPPWR